MYGLVLKYTNKSFEWLDKTDRDYNNLSEDAKKDGVNPCVEMSLGRHLWVNG